MGTGEVRYISDGELVKAAISMKERSYAPYSNFHVGAALLCENGEVYTGCNVENSSFGAAICAERAAVVSAAAAANLSFIKLAIAGDGEDYCVPCGICRQFIAEFTQDIVLLCADKTGKYKEFKLSQLLPNSFKL